MDAFLLFLLALVIQSVLSGALLWCGMMLTGEHGDIRALFLAAFLANLFRAIPYVGGWISFFVLLILLSKWTSVDIWPSGILVVLVANFLGTFLSLMLLAAIV